MRKRALQEAYRLGYTNIMRRFLRSPEYVDSELEESYMKGVRDGFRDKRKREERGFYGFRNFQTQ